MGARGVGAGVRRQAQAALAASPIRALPWKKRGLARDARAIAFLEDLPITKGPLTGSKMRLLPEQAEFVRNVYGRLLPNGRRRTRIAAQSLPRGNGKSGLLSGIALCHLLGPEAETRGEVYSAAIDRQQAGILFAEMEAIILQVPEFASRVNIQRFHKRIEVLDGDGKGSTYEALSSDARRAHGLAPSLWVYDELAQAKDRELLDNLRTAMGKRAEPLGIIISTQAPDDEHPLSQIIDDGLTGADPSTYVQLIAAPLDADPFDEATIRACNPAVGVFLDLDDLLQQAEQARRMPAFEPRFRNLRLNQRVEAGDETRLCTAPVWRLGSAEVDLKRLKGRACYGGLDLSGKHDLSALVLVFPDDEPEPGYDVVPFFWTPEGQLDVRTPAERDLFRQWIKSEHLQAIPGPVIRYGFIAQQLAAVKRDFDLRAVGYDRWRIEDLKGDMADAGIEVPLEEFGQGFKDMAPAIDFFAELALTGKLRHGGHPVLTANVANAILLQDPAGNQKIDKQSSNRRATTRIDGAVAMVMALGTARRFVDQGPKVEAGVYFA